MTSPALALIALAPWLVFGHQAANQARANAGDAIFSTETRLVQLPVTVMDKTGHLMTSLPEGVFQVFENGVRQQIKLFKQEDVPVSLGLVIDDSGSMHKKRAAVEKAALTLVGDSNKQDEVFIVNFNDQVNLDADFTSDVKVMKQGLTRVDSRGGTAMRDALGMAAGHLNDAGKRDKKVILVVTDGNDNASVATLDTLIRLAQQDNVLIYGIGLLSEENPKEAEAAKVALDLLVEATGGEVFYPRDVSEVEAIAHKVAYDLRNQYTIGYTPSNAARDGTFRQIKVEVSWPGDPVAHTRSGYYATPDRQ